MSFYSDNHDNDRLMYIYLQDLEKSGLFKCYECRFTASAFRDICIHFIKEHTVGNLEGQFQCPYCSDFILEQDIIRKHIASCRVKCQEWKSQNLPNISLRSENKNQQFGKQIPKKEIMLCSTDETPVVKPFKCDICNKDFELKRLLMNHMKRVHLRGQVSLLSCGLCSAEFLQQHSLNVHRSAAHHVTGDDLDKPVVRKRLFLHHLKCHTCSFYTFDKLRLERHSSICNPNGGVCSKCKMNFIKKKDLSLHMKYEHSDLSVGGNKHYSEKLVEENSKGLLSFSVRADQEHLVNMVKTEKISQVSGGRLEMFEKETLGSFEEDKQESHLTRHSPNHLRIAETLMNHVNREELNKTIEERLKMIDKEISDIIQSGRSFSSFDIIKFTNRTLHILYLVDKGTFRCFFCSIELPSPTSVRSHFRKSHLKLFQCQDCSFVSRNHLVLKKHCASQHSTYSRYLQNVTFVCEVCGLVLHRENQLARHMISEHNKHLTLDRPTRFRCGKCDLNFPNHYERNKHYRDVHEKEGGPYFCSFCSKIFDQKYKVTAHEKKVHCPDKDKFKCTICGYKTGSKERFGSHMGIHTDEKPYACSICGMRFNQKHNMERHMLTHTKEQKYSCPVCDQKFSQGCSMKRHLLTHDKFKPFQCGVCEAVYSQLYPLKQHLKKKHAEVDVEDNIVRLSKAQQTQAFRGFKHKTSNQ